MDHDSILVYMPVFLATSRSSSRDGKANLKLSYIKAAIPATNAKTPPSPPFEASMGFAAALLALVVLDA
jgi:hypothetical protein